MQRTEADTANQTQLPKYVVKSFLIRGGTKKDRQDKMYELIAQDTHHAFSTDHSDDELVILFLSSFDAETVSFEKAKQLAGNMILPEATSISIYGGPRFGIFEVKGKSLSNTEISMFQKPAINQQKKPKPATQRAYSKATGMEVVPHATDEKMAEFYERIHKPK